MANLRALTDEEIAAWAAPCRTSIFGAADAIEALPYPARLSRLWRACARRRPRPPSRPPHGERAGWSTPPRLSARVNRAWA